MSHPSSISACYHHVEIQPRYNLAWCIRFTLNQQTNCLGWHVWTHSLPIHFPPHIFALSFDTCRPMSTPISTACYHIWTLVHVKLGHFFLPRYYSTYDDLFTYGQIFLDIKMISKESIYSPIPRIPTVGTMVLDLPWGWELLTSKPAHHQQPTASSSKQSSAITTKTFTFNI